MIKRLNVVFIFLFIIFGVDIHSQQQPAPFLYYFSNDNNAFVIERVDGTGTSLFAVNVMDSGVESVLGAGWSPSGDWFVWIGVSNYLDDRQQVGYVYSVANSQVSELVSDEIEPLVHHLSWSPTSDYLLVGYAKECCSPTEYVFEVIDVLNASAMHTFHISSTVEHIQPYWYDDGAGIVFYYEQYNNTTFDGRFLRKESLAGESQIIPVGVSYGGVSHSDWIAFSDPEYNTLILWNLITDIRLAYNFPDGIYRFGQWSDRGTHYAILVEQECGNALACLSDLWLASTMTIDFTSVAENVYYHERDLSVWADEDPILFFTSTGSFGYYHADTRVHASVTIPDWANYGIPSFTWLTDDSVLVWSRRTEDNVRTVYQYTFESQNLSTAVTIDSNYIRPSFSPNGNLWISRDGDVYLITNIADGSQIPFQSHSVAQWANDGFRTRWHPSSNWFITVETIPLDHLGEAYGVVSQDGSVRREFGTCVYRPSNLCADWLPAQVDLAQIR